MDIYVFPLQESLRLYPPAANTFRLIREDDYDIAGYKVPKNTIVAVSLTFALLWIHLRGCDFYTEPIVDSMKHSFC